MCTLKPVYLLADSGPLFSSSNDVFDFIEEIIRSGDVDFSSVAYIGASSGDDLLIYNEIFLPAFARAEIFERWMIVAHPTATDEANIAVR
jgi:hypothetical protein